MTQFIPSSLLLLNSTHPLFPLILNLIIHFIFLLHWNIPGDFFSLFSEIHVPLLSILLCALRLHSMVLRQLGSLGLWLLVGLGQCEALTRSQELKKINQKMYSTPTLPPWQVSFLYQLHSHWSGSPFPIARASLGSRNSTHALAF